MWRLFVFLGGVIWLATIASSASLNYMAGFELGRSPAESHVFAVIGMCADLWKAIGPVFCAALWRARRVVAASLSIAVWLACFTFAVTAALGLAARNRGAVVGGHEALHLSYESVTRELEGVERRRAELGSVGVVAEREAALAERLAAPVPGGTVASLSDNCSKDHWRTRGACAEIAGIRREFASALEGRRLDERIGSLRQELEGLRQQGATRDSDPQARLIARLSFGNIASGDVGLFVTLLLVAMIELTSAFAPLIIVEFAGTVPRPVEAGRGWSRPVATERGTSDNPAGVALIARPDGTMQDYFSARIVLDASARVMPAELFGDYEHWCAATGKRSIGERKFFAELEAIVRSDLDGQIEKRNRAYRGLRILPREAHKSRLIEALPGSRSARKGM